MPEGAVPVVPEYVALVVALGWFLCDAVGAVALLTNPAARHTLANLPHYVSSA
jgi:hypothetical protein